MGVISVRLNKKEENIVKWLASHMDTDKSTLIKKSLMELYENIVDLKGIDEFETKEKKKTVKFFAAKDIF
jgi:hypothetical protein